VSASELRHFAYMIRELGLKPSAVANDIGVNAIEYGAYNWQVFPLNGKIPAIPKSAGGRGVLDATSDTDQIAEWWGGRYAGCNIGGRVPDSMMVLDIDPRHDGDRSIASLEEMYGPLPETLTTITGRGDGGRHLFFRRPPGKLSSKRLGAGIDIKTSTGYVVLPPSIHPDGGNPYVGVNVDGPVAAPPGWLMGLLLPEKNTHRITPGRPRSTLHGRLSGTFSGSIADQFTKTATWPEILMPHGWSCLDHGDPDADGAKWLHPTATSACSATIRHGCLFVYSPNTPFDITESSDPRGYTKFRAFAVLNHGGDMSAAARAIIKGIDDR
jgi:Bifunctional DNA primase/polymerase, N-terminal